MLYLLIRPIWVWTHLNWTSSKITYFYGEIFNFISVPISVPTLYRSAFRLDAKIVSCIGKLKDAQKNLEDETLNRINIQNQLQTKEVEQFLF